MMLKRRLAIAFVVASFLVCLASLALWLVSPDYHLFILVSTGQTAWTIDTALSRLRVQCWPSLTPASRVSFVRRYEVGRWPDVDAALVWVEGWRLPRAKREAESGRWGFSLPFGYPAVAGAVAPAWWFIARTRARRRRQLEKRDICPQCGYDLRASPQRCPECGLQRSEKREPETNARLRSL